MKIKRYAFLVALTSGEIKAICRQVGIIDELPDEKLDEVILNHLNAIIFDRITELKTKNKDIVIEEAQDIASNYAKRRNATNYKKTGGAFIQKNEIEIEDSIRIVKEQEEAITRKILQDAITISDDWLMVKNPFPKKEDLSR